MKRRNFLPHLAPPVFRGDSQAAIGHQQLNGGVSGSVNVKNPSQYFGCTNSCYRNWQCRSGEMAAVPDPMCVLRNCGANYVMNQAQGTFGDQIVSTIQSMKNQGLV